MAYKVKNFQKSIQLDFFFSYFFVFRFLLINKYGLFLNIHQLPGLHKLFIFFNIKSITDLQDKRSLNYFYFVRFFFGQQAFFTKIKSYFRLGVFFYSYKIFTVFFSYYCFFPLAVFVNDFLGFSSREFFLFKIYNAKGFFYLKFFDMTIFLEKKNNLGFYYLKDPVQFKIFLTGTDFLSSFLLLSCFKL